MIPLAVFANEFGAGLVRLGAIAAAILAVVAVVKLMTAPLERRVDEKIHDAIERHRKEGH